MTSADRKGFADLLAGVYAMYGKELSPAVLEIWWRALEGFEARVVADAFGRHAMNPDGGQFLPKPADIVKMVSGSSLDSAMQAVTKLEEAMARVGSMMTVVFDDPLIHVVVDEMGGWIALCGCSLKDWQFRRTEFLNRYRGYKVRRETPPWRPQLTGLADGHNASKGLKVSEENVRLIGDKQAALAVRAHGLEAPRIGLSRMEAPLALESKA